MRVRAALLSAAIHACAVLALLLLVIRGPLPPRFASDFRIQPLFAPRVSKQQGGGGGRSTLPAPRGRAPVPVLRRIFVTPAIQNQPAKLPIQQALLEAPEFNIAAPQIGDPAALGAWPSGGPGGPFGIGDGPGTGLGAGDKSGVQGRPPAPSTTRVTRGPQVLYQPEPEYSEEARKAHFQGTVVLSIEIDTNGNPRAIQVVRGVGLGLDEKAIQAVEQWKFRPAYSGDRAVVVEAQVEVSFHLL